VLSSGKALSQKNSYSSSADTMKMTGYLVLIEGDINEMMIFPDTSGLDNFFDKLEYSGGYRIPDSDNFDIYRLRKIAPTYKVDIKYYPGRDTVLKRDRIKIIKAEIRYRPWNTGMPISDSDWTIWYKKVEYQLKYKIDLDGSIIDAKPVDKKKLRKFNRFKGSPPPKQII
jgi:hypothetical protein